MGILDDSASCVSSAAVGGEITDSCCIPKPRAGEKTILLVEDEMFVREVTCKVLRGAGYRVLSARDSSVAERWHEVSCDEIDLLITDVILPGENGRVLAEKLRKRNENLRVLFVSGYSEQICLLSAEAVACLAKPFSSQALLHSVRGALYAKDGCEG
jgi:two-component system, cell cycle sensor histidine kinase and response regulator CckA